MSACQFNMVQAGLLQELLGCQYTKVQFTLYPMGMYLVNYMTVPRYNCR